MEDIIKAFGGCRPSFLFTGYVVEQAPGSALPVPASLRLLSDERKIERDLTLSLRYEPPSPKFSRSCPTSTSYRLKVSRGKDFLYLTRGLTKKIRVDSLDLVVTWGNLELAFANSEELRLFVDALKYVEFVDEKPGAKGASEAEQGAGAGGRRKAKGAAPSAMAARLRAALFAGDGQLQPWVVPASISVAVVATLSYHLLKRKHS